MRRRSVGILVALAVLGFACGSEKSNNGSSRGEPSGLDSAGQPGGPAADGTGGADTQSGEGGGSADTVTPAAGHGGGAGQGQGAGSSAAGGSAAESFPDDPGCVDKCGPKFDLFFAQDKIASLKIRFDPAVTEPLGYGVDEWLDLLWSKWQVCPEGPWDYVPVEVAYESPDGVGNTVMRQVGIRIRGTQSRGKTDVQGFKIDVNKLLEAATGDQVTRRFAGMNRINVLSVERDPSLMVQCLATKMIRDSGAVATHCNFIKVFVNGKPYGVMPNVEESDDGRFLTHHYDTNDGSLYECSAGCDFPDSTATLEYWGDKYEGDYLTAYDPIRGEDGDAERNLIPMLQCGDADTTPDDEAFRSCITNWIDVEGWLRVIAAESILPSVESFTGVKRNYYLYFKPEDISYAGGFFQLYSWDYDTAFHRQPCYPTDCNPFTAVAGWHGPLGTRARLVLRLEEVFKANYCQIMSTFLADVYQPEQVDAMADILAPAVEELQSFEPISEEIVYPTVDEWQAEVQTIRDFIVSHKVDVQAMVDEACN